MIYLYKLCYFGFPKSIQVVICKWIICLMGKNTTLLLLDIVLYWAHVFILLCWGGFTPKGIYNHTLLFRCSGGIPKEFLFLVLIVWKMFLLLESRVWAHDPILVKNKSKIKIVSWIIQYLFDGFFEFTNIIYF